MVNKIAFTLLLILTFLFATQTGRVSHAESPSFPIAQAPDSPIIHCTQLDTFNMRKDEFTRELARSRYLTSKITLQQSVIYEQTTTVNELVSRRLEYDTLVKRRSWFYRIFHK